MNATKTYRYLVKWALTAFVPCFLLSCERIKDDMDDCGIYLEFIYDHNMEYTDSFDPQVGSVDIFVFDEQGYYLFTKRSPREGLTGAKRMFLGGDLPFGQYKVLTVGGLSDSFRVSGDNDGALVAGKTSLEEVQVALKRESAVVSHEFPALWIGTTQEVEYRADLSVWPVPLLKVTNHFDLVLARSEGSSPKPSTDITPYTFEIVTPEGAAYGHDNAPKKKEVVTYAPYFSAPGEGETELSEARIQTNRLLYAEEYNYDLIIRSSETGKILWEYDLMNLLGHTKPASRPDGTALPMQEYLDRQSEWHIVVLYKEDPGGGNEGFVALKVVINDWIVWINDIGV